MRNDFGVPHLDWKFETLQCKFKNGFEKVLERWIWLNCSDNLRWFFLYLQFTQK